MVDGDARAAVPAATQQLLSPATVLAAPASSPTRAIEVRKRMFATRAGCQGAEARTKPGVEQSPARSACRPCSS